MNLIGRCIDMPVLTQEMRIRQRGAKPFWVLFVYVLVLGIAALITYESNSWARWGHTQWQDLSRVGRDLFTVLAMVQLSLITLIVPAYSSSSVSFERERGTLDLLSLTLLHSGSIVRQKLVAAIAQVLMMVLASMPVVAVTFMLGGVSPLEVAVVYGIIIATAVLLSAIGMLCSCCLKNSRSSTFVAYLIPLIVFLAIPVCWEWMSYVSRVGYGQVMGDNPLAFTLMFALAGAIPAFAVYGGVTLFLSRKLSRAVRIAIFGLSYAMPLLIMSTPSIEQWLFRHSTFDLVGILNPFASLAYYITTDGGSLPAGYEQWMVGITIAASLGIAYLLERISCFRFGALRRSE